MSKSKPKSDTAENKPSQEAFDAHQLMKLMRANDNMQAAKNEHHSVIKSVETKSINLKAAAAALKVKKSGKSDEMLDFCLKFAAYTMVLGHGFTDEQIDLFAHVSTREPAEDKAFDLGRKAAYRGEGDGANPYAVGSSQSNRFIEGLGVGATERHALIEMEMQANSDELIEGDRYGEDAPDGDDDGDDEGSASDLTGDDPFEAPGADFIDPNTETANEIPA